MGLTILVIDDDKHTLRILESLLRNDPALATCVDTVLTASDGQEGMERFAAERPDLVITDLLMPRMDGFGVCRAVRGHAAGAETALFAVSAVYKDRAVIGRLKEEFGADFFQKPFQVPDLVRAVRQLAERRGAAPPAAPPEPESALPVAAVEPADRQEGDLAQRPLGRLLFDLLETRAGGTLLCRRGRVRKEIFLRMGHPVGADSNVRQETLGYYLVARHIIDEEQHREALARSRQERIKLGQALVRLGAVKEEDLVRHLAAVVRLKVVNALRWTDGDYRFTPGDTYGERMPNALEPVSLVLNGLKRTAHDDEIAKQLAVHAAARARLTPRAERHRESFVKVFGDEARAALERRPLIGELLRRGKDGLAVVAGVDALLHTGMAELEQPAARAGRAVPGATGAFAAITDEVPQADPLALDNLVVPAAPPAEPSVAASPSASALYHELFGEETSQVAPLPQPAPPPVAKDDGVVMAPLDIPESGVIELYPAGAPAGPAPAPAAPDPRLEHARALILRAYLDIHDKDFYEVLGVDSAAAQDEIAASYAGLVRTYRLADFAELDLGRDYARLEELHVVFRRAYDTLSDPIRRLDYDRQLGRGGAAAAAPGAAPTVDRFAAELSFREGERLFEAGRYAEAAAAFEAAARSDPDDADYHAHAAWAVFHARRQDRETVQAYLAQAFAIDRDLASAHDFAGRIAAALGHDEEALQYLERALDLDAARLEAFTALEQILARRGEWPRLERQYRKLIHRVGERDPDLSLRLWWNLAEVYRTRLGDLESARMAFETACRLAPDEPVLAQALAEVSAHDPARWRDTVRALRHLWRLRPEDPAPGHALFELHRSGARTDAALVVATALQSRGAADVPAVREFLRSYRPRFLVHISTLAPARWRNLRHPDDDPEIGELFALMAGAIREQHPLGLADLEVGDDDLVSPDQVPADFTRILAYVCGLFGVAAPAVYRRTDFGAEVHVGGTDPSVLLCGPEALAETDKLVLGFRLGRAATYLGPGRATSGSLPSRVLKRFLLGAMTLVVPGLAVEDPESFVAAARERLSRLPAETQVRVRELVSRLSRDKTSLNLSRWSRSLARSADRAGLLVCNDLAIAARLVEQSGARGAADELIDFALSEEYLAAREELGLAVAA